MGDQVPHDVSQHLVPTRVVGVVVGVDQGVHGPTADVTKLDEQGVGRVGELAVDDGAAVQRVHPADGATAIRVDTDISPKHAELRATGVPEEGGGIGGQTGGKAGCGTLHEI